MLTRLTHRVRDAAFPLVGRLAPGPNGHRERVTLLMQPDHLGDIVLSQPAVQLLRDRFPDERLVAVVGPWSSAAVGLAWPVDDIVEVEYPGFARSGGTRKWNPYTLLYKERDRLALLNAGRAIILRPDAWWAAWLGRLVAREVVGSDDPRVASFATSCVTVKPDDHAVARVVAIAAHATGSTQPPAQWNTTPAAVPVPPLTSAASDIIERAEIDGDYLVIHPGAGAPVKEWAEHRWRAVASALVAEGFSVLITGSASERSMSERIAANLCRVTSIAGDTDLDVLRTVLGHASIVVGCDSGPLHLAVATGVPTVHLFGPSDPGRYGPWGDPDRHRVVRAGWTCRRCGDLSLERPKGCGCMLAIQVEDVVSTTLELIHARTA